MLQEIETLLYPVIIQISKRAPVGYRPKQAAYVSPAQPKFPLKLIQCDVTVIISAEILHHGLHSHDTVVRNIFSSVPIVDNIDHKQMQRLQQAYLDRQFIRVLFCVKRFPNAVKAPEQLIFPCIARIDHAAGGGTGQTGFQIFFPDNVIAQAAEKIHMKNDRKKIQSFMEFAG